MHGSQYVTNQLHGSQYATSITNQKRLLAAKFFSSSRQWRLRRNLVTKPYGVQTQQLLHKNDELWQILSPVKICLNKLCSTLVQLGSSIHMLSETSHHITVQEKILIQISHKISKGWPNLKAQYQGNFFISWNCGWYS